MADSKNPILAVRIRGTAGDNPDVEKTMESLMMVRPYQARLLDNTPSNVGMLRSVKALVAWGEVDPMLLGHILEKRGEQDGADGVGEQFVRLLGKTSFEDLAKAVVAGEVGIRDLYRAGLKPRFRLHPPRGGFKRSLRRAATDGGELGYRGPAINLLVKRMV
ncbi:MAG TPA: 50S ribosomal protein L30 [Candidatus Bathyarchaeia archaeon]|nr:50S ribosomal protein L30 [Candidatus Bathyarchaeia archaeon]